MSTRHGVQAPVQKRKGREDDGDQGHKRPRTTSTTPSGGNTPTPSSRPHTSSQASSQAQGTTSKSVSVLVFSSSSCVKSSQKASEPQRPKKGFRPPIPGTVKGKTGTAKSKSKKVVRVDESNDEEEDEGSDKDEDEEEGDDGNEPGEVDVSMYSFHLVALLGITNIPGALSKRWKARVYACYTLPTEVTHSEEGRPYLSFRCSARSCKKEVRRYLDKKDGSTKNLLDHAKACWGEDVIEEVMSAANVGVARKHITEPYRKNGKITGSFERKKGKETYSHTQHTKTETKCVSLISTALQILTSTRFEIAIWVCQDNRPFTIVKDTGFLRLMKTGRPGYYIPSSSTVSRDVKRIFTRTRKRIARMLQECNRVNFQMDAWTSPNHKAYLGITVTFEREGTITTLVLDLVEVAKVCKTVFSK